MAEEEKREMRTRQVSPQEMSTKIARFATMKPQSTYYNKTKAIRIRPTRRSPRRSWSH